MKPTYYVSGMRIPLVYTGIAYYDVIERTSDKARVYCQVTFQQGDEVSQAAALVRAKQLVTILKEKL